MASDRYARIFTTYKGELLLESMDGSEALGKPFRFNVFVLTSDLSFDGSTLLAQHATVQVDLTSGTREFSGRVTNVSRVGRNGRYMRYLLVLQPSFWLLTQQTNCRIFQNESIPSIVKKILAEGDVPVRSALFGEYPELEYTVQYRESDFNFVSRLLERAGIYYFFEHEVGNHTLVLADSVSSHSTKSGYDKVRYLEPGPIDVEEHLESWRVSFQATPGRYQATDYDFKKPNALLLSNAPSPPNHPLAAYEIFDYPGGYTELKRGEDIARVRLDERQAPQRIVEANGTVRGLGPGHLFQVTDCDYEDPNCVNLITYAHYGLELSAYESSGAPSERRPFRSSFWVIDSKQPFRPARTTPTPIVEGPQSAVVVGAEGKEIEMDEHGRIKVQFIWDRYGSHDQKSSCWIRVAQIWAGPGWGAVFTPRIGHEVLVDFVNGDPDCPIVIGSLYNDFNKPPYDPSTEPTKSGIRSDTTLGGGSGDFNEIRFEDKKGQEDLFVQAQKTQTTVVKDSQSISVGSDRSLTVGGNETTSVKKDRSVTVEGNQTTTVKKDRTTTVQEGNETHTIVAGALDVTVAQDVTEIYLANQATTVTGHRWLNADSQAFSATNSIVLDQGTGQVSARFVGGKFNVLANVSAELRSSATHVFLDAGGFMNHIATTKIMISCQGASVVLEGNSVKVNASTAVEITAPKATITCGGAKIELAGGNVTVTGGTVKLNC